MKKIWKILLLFLILNIADSIFYISMIWHIDKIHKDSFYLGLFFSITLIPDLLIMFLGPIIDKFNQKKLLSYMIYIQIISIFIFLLFNKILNVYLLYLIIFLSVFASTLSYVIGETIIPKLVEKEEIIFTNSIFEFSYKVLDSLLNSISSILIISYGIYTMFKYDIFIFLISLLILIGIKLNIDYKKDKVGKEKKYDFREYKEDLREGIVYVKNNGLLKQLAIVFLIINFFNSIQAVAYPIYSKKFFDGEIYYGLFLTIKGISGITGSLFSSVIIKTIEKFNFLGLLLSLNGLLWLIAIFINNIYLNLFLYFIGYLFMAIYNIGFNSIFYIVPPQNLLGRVNSTVDSCIAFAMPLGSFIGGIIINDNILYIMSILPTVMFILGIYLFKNKMLEEFKY